MCITRTKDGTRASHALLVAPKSLSRARLSSVSAVAAQVVAAAERRDRWWPGTSIRRGEDKMKRKGNMKKKKKNKIKGKKALPLNPRLVINLTRVLCVYDDDDYMLFYLLFLYYHVAREVRSFAFFFCMFSLYNELLCDYGVCIIAAERKSTGKALRFFFLMSRAKG